MLDLIEDIVHYCSDSLELPERHHFFDGFARREAKNHINVRWQLWFENVTLFEQNVFIRIFWCSEIVLLITRTTSCLASQFAIFNLINVVLPLTSIRFPCIFWFAVSLSFTVENGELIQTNWIDL